MSSSLSLSLKTVRVALVAFVVILVGGLVFGAAAQANQVIIGVTNLSNHTLHRAGEELSRGGTWVSENGKSVLPTKAITPQSTVGFTAVAPPVVPIAGSASYRVGDTSSTIRISFNNPIYGTNTYSCTPDVLCTVTNSISGPRGYMLVTVRG